MRWTVGTKIAVAFLLTVSIFLVVGVVSYRSMNSVVEASNLRRSTFEQLSGVRRALIAVQDVQIAQRFFLASRNEADLASYRQTLTAVDSNLQNVRTLMSGNAADQRRAEALGQAVQTYLAFIAQTVEAAVRAPNVDDAETEATRSRRVTLLDAIRSEIGEIETEKTALLEERIAESDANAASARFALLFGTLAAIVTAALAGAIVTSNIARPLAALTASAERITAGDLSDPGATLTRQDEVGVLSQAFARMRLALREMAGVAERMAAGDLRSAITPQSSNDVLGNAFAQMVNNLRQQISQLVEGANVLGAAASQIVASTTQLASSAAETATAVSETTTTVEEVRQTAQLASQKARHVSDAAQKAAQVAQAGRKSTEDVTAGMGRIRQQMDAIASSTAQLSEQTRSIGQIIASVEDLSIQSNLLAVNASIEAAKAGESGRGFAVVAQEVKALSEQSRQATAQVRALLSDIQKATTSAVLATEQGSKAVDAGVHQTQVAADSILALAGNVSEAAQAATQIAASSQQQLVGVDQVASAMDSIKQASSQNVASAKQLEVAARNLSVLGQQLKQIVALYQV